MANQEQLEILKQGVDVWNKWVVENPDIDINLDEADLSETDLSKADLLGANLHGANLREAILQEANLREANLSATKLIFAYLGEADLQEANLRKAYLSYSDLSSANLYGADLHGADLYGCNFDGSNLREADLSYARTANTIFADIDLSNTKGLDSIAHDDASIVGTSALFSSKGNIPEVFLRGCGLSDWEIEAAKLYNPELILQRKVRSEKL